MADYIYTITNLNAQAPCICTGPAQAMPAVSSTATFPVSNTMNFAVGEEVWMQVAGYVQVTAIPDALHLTLMNTGNPGNASPGAMVGSSGTMIVPSGAAGAPGSNATAGGNLSGPSTAIPAATGTGRIYLCDDIPASFLDDPTTSAWKTYTGGSMPGSPVPSTGWTAIGAASVTPRGSSVMVAGGYTNKQNCILRAIPSGVNISGGPWIAEAVYDPRFTSHQYPSMGLILANGTTSGTSVGIFHGIYQYGISPTRALSRGIWSEVLGIQSRPNIYYYTNSGDVFNTEYSRILFDGSNYLFQISRSRGSVWETLYISTPTYATISLTFTQYGISAGCPNGLGQP